MSRAGGRGFTLLEVMTAMALATVVIGAALALLIGISGSSQRITNIGDAQITARQALDELAVEIQQAGLGASSGQVLIGQGSPPVGRRLPVIWSGPDVTITEPGGQTLVTNSIYILGSEPTTVGRSASGAELLATVAADSPTGPGSTGLNLYCADATGTPRDCATAAKPGVAPEGPLAGGLPPLLIGDFRNAAFITPTALSGLAGSPGRQTLVFAEQTTAAFAPDPKVPMGFARGANISRARVSHWYLRQASPGTPPVLVRSHPRLSTAAIANQCLAGDNPFLDETTTPGGGVAGADVGAGPVVSLQFRFVTDPSLSDDPAQYQRVDRIGTCDLVPVSQLREVRIQVVAIARNPDKALDPGKRVARYHTPAFEGVGPTPGWDGAGTCPAGACDAYPRRAFTQRIVPRNVQGGRL